MCYVVWAIARLRGGGRGGGRGAGVHRGARPRGHRAVLHPGDAGGGAEGPPADALPTSAADWGGQGTPPGLHNRGTELRQQSVSALYCILH